MNSRACFGWPVFSFLSTPSAPRLLAERGLAVGRVKDSTPLLLIIIIITNNDDDVLSVRKQVSHYPSNQPVITCRKCLD